MLVQGKSVEVLPFIELVEQGLKLDLSTLKQQLENVVIVTQGLTISKKLSTGDTISATLQLS